MPLPRPGETFGRYRVERPLGHGGMGTVHLATDTRLNRQVALKVISDHLAGDPAFVARFLHEAEVLARLDSPHVIAVYDSGEVDGTPYTASQYVPGGDLQGWLAEHGPMASEEAIEVCAQVAEALHAAHGAGIVHSDVKPSNILLRHAGTPRVQAYLCDFGLAVPLAEQAERSDAVAGSWAYLSPERVQGGPATPAGDVYALGCVLWACLHGGTPPYVGPDHAVGHAHVTAPVPRLAGSSDADRHVNEVLAGAMAKDPARRHASAEQLRAHLRGEGPGPARPRARRSPALLLGAAAVALVLVAGAAWALWPAGAPSDPPAAGSPVAGDLDGDGLGDLVVAQPGAGSSTRVSVLSGDGRSFAETWTGEAEQVLRGDVDGDGADELFSFTADRTLTEIGPDPDGRWDLSGGLDLEGAASVLARLDDTDGDGDDDLLLWANSESGADPSSIWVAAGDDGFGTPAQVLDLPWGVADHAITSGDFDGDGAAELAALEVDEDGTRSTIQLFARDGDTYRAEADPARFEEYQRRTAVADVDGRPGDEVVSYEDRLSGQNQLLVRQVSGSGFGEGRLWAQDGDPALIPVITLGATDADGDGLTDVFLVVRSRGAPDELIGFRSTGTGFAERSSAGTLSCADGCDAAPYFVN